MASDVTKTTPQCAESQSALAPGLYVCATPIGNARDVTLRALDVMRSCDAILAEDTRQTAKLLALHGISRPLLAYNDHNAPRMRPRILQRLSNGDRLALVSDAGTPLISDPGYKLVREALAEGVKIHAIPGPSAVLTALVLSGLPTDRFVFAGFLPPKAGPRRRALESVKATACTLIFFESPQRLADSLADMGTVLGSRETAIARELTKLHEEVRRGDLLELAKYYSDVPPPRGEVTVVVAPPQREMLDFDRLDSLLDKALAFMPLRAAVDLVSEAMRVPRGEVYARALSRRESSPDGG